MDKKEYNRLCAAIWREANPERAKIIWQRWTRNNPAKAKANTARWRAANPEKVEASRARYQLKKAAKEFEQKMNRSTPQDMERLET